MLFRGLLITLNPQPSSLFVFLDRASAVRRPRLESRSAQHCTLSTSSPHRPLQFVPVFVQNLLLFTGLIGMKLDLPVDFLSFFEV